MENMSYIFMHMVPLFQMEFIYMYIMLVCNHYWSIPIIEGKKEVKGILEWIINWVMTIRDNHVMYHILKLNGITLSNRCIDHGSVTNDTCMHGNFNPNLCITCWFRVLFALPPPLLNSALIYGGHERLVTQPANPSSERGSSAGRQAGTV